MLYVRADGSNKSVSLTSTLNFSKSKEPNTGYLYEILQMSDDALNLYIHCTLTIQSSGTSQIMIPVSEMIPRQVTFNTRCLCIASSSNAQFTEFGLCNYSYQWWDDYTNLGIHFRPIKYPSSNIIISTDILCFLVWT